MILDSSAVAAVFLEEPEAERLLAAIAAADSVSISAATFLELGIVLSHRKAHPMVHALELFFAKLGVRVIPFTDEHRAAALAAWWRYGRSRSPAGLNFGDCIVYATAALADEELLCKGDDFANTDLRRAAY
ncbi:MAG: type II toxin-antitoxin system VapC family toxin [Deltaproteobacteria bacterium]|nr:type II toxin-antitoxin system VapC family toxin [Deltaproteobacteria bacterium]